MPALTTITARWQERSSRTWAFTFFDFAFSSTNSNTSGSPSGKTDVRNYAQRHRQQHDVLPLHKPDGYPDITEFKIPLEQFPGFVFLGEHDTRPFFVEGKRYVAGSGCQFTQYLRKRERHTHLRGTT